MKIMNNPLRGKNWILIAILLMAAVLRLWKLGSIPPHLTPDEASLGYNAYSILRTGRDEYGKVLPIVFKSFGDYKPGLYIYTTVPFVAALGLNEWSVRLPSALAGIFSVYLIYLIVKSLFTSHKSLATIAALVAATMPWLIYFSRGAWEVNVSLALTLAGIYFFLRSISGKRYIIYSSIFFSLTLLTYQGAKLSTGIVILILAFLYWKEILKFDKKKLILDIVIGLIIASPIILSVFRGQAGRLNVFSVFSYGRPAEELLKFKDRYYYPFHSEPLNFARGIMGRYFNHFSGKFLFFEGDFSNPRHSAPNSGMLLLTDMVVLLYGLMVVFRQKITKEILFVLLWLALAPLPAVLSRDQVHAVRAMNMAIPLTMIIAFGYSKLSKWFLVVGGIALVYLLDSYFIHLPKHDSRLWEYGYKQIVETVTPIQGNYKKIKVQQSFAQPYIYFLFYGKYDPAKYQNIAQLTTADSVFDVGYVLKLDNIEFVPIDWSVNRGESGTLFVADTVRIPPEDSKDENLFKVISEIKYLNGRDIAFRIVEVK